MVQDQKVELLAPAGSFESMTAAICAGADAVYMGGSRFGARAYADNPDQDRLLEAIDYVHIHGKRLYMTVNTLIKEREMDSLYDYLSPYYRQGLDGVIVQDYGVLSFIKTHFPDLPIHASTQMTVTGSDGAALLRQMGVKRVVTARELSLEEIRQIHREVDIEIESFVHGALCYCYSGQCLFSSLIGGRSGNRGRCAQTCRLPFDVKKDGKVQNPGDEKYVLSLKDLCTLDLLPELVQAGISSLKIEGRMKSPRYTAGVVSIYRKYLDQYLDTGGNPYRVESSDRKLLLDLFDRGGQTKGYYQQQNGREMVAFKEKPAFRQANQQLFDYLDQTYVNGNKQEPVTAHIKIKPDSPVIFTLSLGEHQVKVTGEVPTKAINQPVTRQSVEKQLGKTGNSPFFFSQLDVEIEGQVFLSVQSLNQLRRQGIDSLRQQILEDYRRELSQDHGTPLILRQEEIIKQPSMAVSLERPDTLEVAVMAQSVSLIYLDITGFDRDSWKGAVDLCHQHGKQCLLMLPHIFRQQARTYLEKELPQLLQAGFDGLVLRSMEQVFFLRRHQIDTFFVFDHPIYVYNRQAAALMKQLGADRLTLPVEQNKKELQELGLLAQELLVYGRLPMMVTAQCLKETMSGCQKQEDTLWLKDRMGKEFPVKNHCKFCYNTIYNASPLSLLTEAKEIEKLSPSVIRLQFTTESKEEVGAIITAFTDVLLFCQESGFTIPDHTKGHWKRGVE